MNDGIHVMHRTGLFSSFRAVVLYRNTEIQKSLVKDLVLLKHHILIACGEDHRGTAELLHHIGEVVDIRWKISLGIKVETCELSRALNVIAADRAGTLTCNGVCKVRDPHLLTCFFGIEKDRGNEAEISAGRIAHGVKSCKPFFA